MRDRGEAVLRAEYLFAAGRYADIRFHPEPGKATVLAYSGGPDRARFGRYLIQLFANAGSASLQAAADVVVPISSVI